MRDTSNRYLLRLRNISSRNIFISIQNILNMLIHPLTNKESSLRSMNWVVNVRYVERVSVDLIEREKYFISKHFHIYWKTTLYAHQCLKQEENQLVGTSLSLPPNSYSNLFKTYWICSSILEQVENQVLAP